ncbi:hypothetical protein TSUD_292790 [Trifolium subterraneum]|uniref:Protein FAR1-RELATED SEQUENCE n=1 Tax=Trifolium subterraneum TaxID=3900 RepID=A0A2Z6N5K7_TRISU|nr:hypothetical protein TSUD_292790 [Trifolium subterraneum]
MEGDDFDVDFESNDDETYLVSSEDESTEDGDCASDNGIDEGDVNVADSLYGKSKGFAVGKSDSRIREGPEDRKLELRRMSRTKYLAKLRVKLYLEKDIYKVIGFVERHNHELTPSRLVHLYPVYRKISEADKAQIDGLHTRGIRTCHIMGHMVAQKGGYVDVGFTKKDLYNYFDKKMRAIIKDGDVAAALNYLNMKNYVVMDDIIKLQKKYCGNDDNGRQNSEVGDPLPIPGKGAPKKKKNEPKSVRRCGKCNDPSHNARTCSGKHKMPEQGEKPSVDADSVSISDSVSQIVEKKKRKASGNGERSLQNKSSHPPKDRSANVGMTTPNGIPSTSGHLHPMYGLQPVMPMVHPMIQPMHVRPMYPMYGMSFGQTSNSCYGLLQQTMRGHKED